MINLHQLLPPFHLENVLLQRTTAKKSGEHGKYFVAYTIAICVNQFSAQTHELIKCCTHAVHKQRLRLAIPTGPRVLLPRPERVEFSRYAMGRIGREILAGFCDWLPMVSGSSNPPAYFSSLLFAPPLRRGTVSNRRLTICTELYALLFRWGCATMMDHNCHPPLKADMFDRQFNARITP